jgi:dTDP-4-dehydrorhamnose reductase
VQGYRKAVFSGLPTVELARVMRDHVIPGRSCGASARGGRTDQQVRAARLVADVYGKDTMVEADDRLVIDRIADARRFREAPAYVRPPGRSSCA